MSGRAQLMDDEWGSSAVEFLLVGLLLTALTLGVLQLGLAVYVRNLVHDAAVEGAYHGALADVAVEEGAARAQQVIERTVGEGFVGSVSSRRVEDAGLAAVEVTVVATLPLVGLLGLPDAWEVTARAPAESLDG